MSDQTINAYDQAVTAFDRWDAQWRAILGRKLTTAERALLHERRDELQASLSRLYVRGVEGDRRKAKAIYQRRKAREAVQ